MSLSIFINFAGNCREAVTYYAEAFGKEVPRFMLYSEAPDADQEPFSAEEKNYIMYTSLEIFEAEIMFSDVPKSMPFVVGNNISPVISSTDQEEVKAAFSKLKADGKVEMELQKTFWSPLYGAVEDKYGVTWQLNYDDGSEYSF